MKKRKNKKSENQAMKILILIQTVLIFLCVSAHADNSTVGDPGQEFPAWITSQYPPYDATNKIDPFVSFVKIREYETMQAAWKAKREKKATTPLETVDVQSLKLIGIINKDGDRSLAMVELPDGKGYLIRPGMSIGLYDGVVTSIGNDKLVVEEDIIDVFGESKKRTINLRLRQEKE